MTTKLRLMLGVTLVLGVLLFGLFIWPRPTGIVGPGTIWQTFQHAMAMQDTLQLRRLERARDSLAQNIRIVDSMFKARDQRLADSLRAMTQIRHAAERASVRARARADSLAQLLARTRDDDDSLPRLVALVAAQDSVIRTVTQERDAALVTMHVLLATVSARDSQLMYVNAQLAEALRQRDAYRKRGKRDWLTVGATLAGTVAICRAVADPC